MKKPKIMIAVGIYDGTGYPREAKTKAEQRAVEEALAEMDGDRAAAIAWARLRIPEFRKLSKADDTKLSGAGKVLLKHALLIQRMADEYNPGVLRDIVLSMTIDHEISVGLLQRQFRLTFFTVNRERSEKRDKRRSELKKLESLIFKGASLEKLARKLESMGIPKPSKATVSRDVRAIRSGVSRDE